jgi:hypothetical protein
VRTCFHNMIVSKNHPTYMLDFCRTTVRWFAGASGVFDDGNGECRGTDASQDVLGSDSNVTGLNGLCASHGVAQVAIHSQVTSKETGVVNVHNADMAMY